MFKQRQGGEVLYIWDPWESMQFPNYCLCFMAFPWYPPRSQPERLRRLGRSAKMNSPALFIIFASDTQVPSLPHHQKLVVQTWTLGDQQSHPTQIDGTSPTIALKCIWTFSKRRGNVPSIDRALTRADALEDTCYLIKNHTFPAVSLEDIEIERGKHTGHACTTSWWQNASPSPVCLAHNSFFNLY